jgi:hypothetical protein
MEQQILCSDLVQLDWKAVAGWDRSAVSILEEISPGRASLQTDVPVPIDSAVRIRRGRKTLEGTVRSCDLSDIGYIIGMEFNRDQQWSPGVFRPKHLLDVQKLTRSMVQKTYERSIHQTRYKAMAATIK